MTAVTGNDLPPLNLVDPGSGKGAGWEYDAINETCRRLNCQVNWQTMAWDKMIAAVHDGKYDVGAEGISITEEARQQVAFSIPYMTAEHHLLVRAGENRFQSAPEFAADAKLRVGAQRGSGSFYAAVYGVLDGSEDSPRVKQYPTVRAAVQGLLAGEVDMVVLDGQASRGYLGANAGKLKALAEPLDSEDFGFIFKPGSDLVAPFNAALESMLKDGFTQQLDQKWFFQYDPPAS